MKNLPQSLKYLKYATSRERTFLQISGVGIRERMLPLLVARPAGTLDRFLLYMHTESEMDIGKGWQVFPAGTMILWKDGGGHFYGNNCKNWSHSWLHFHGTFVDELLKSLNIPEQMPLFLPDFGSELDLLIKIYEELTDCNCSADLLRVWLEALLRKLSKKLANHSQNRIPPGLLRLKQWLDQGSDLTCGMKEMVSISGYSVSHLPVLFQEHFRCTPAEYIRRIRMQKAAYELRNLGFTVTEIGERCGYASIHPFSRAFRREFGCSPSQWRKLHNITPDSEQ